MDQQWLQVQSNLQLSDDVELATDEVWLLLSLKFVT
jgi:hypothetical protein